MTAEINNSDLLVQNIETDPHLNTTGIITEIQFEYEMPREIVASIDDKQVRLDDMSEVAKLQRQCSELADLITFLETGKLPEDEKKARFIALEKDLYRYKKKVILGF